jgi:hypothetical protein
MAMRRILLAVLFAAGAILAAAQQAPAPALDAQQLCAREFGDTFKLDPKFSPMLADLDGDGKEDLVLVATSKNPLGGEVDYHYRAIDPYDAYFGWGDPKVTVQFAAGNAAGTRDVLVVHNWRAPKAKFVIINLPFDKLSVARVARKKKALNSIRAEETGGLVSDVFWDGKKYKWVPSYLGNE